MNNKKSVLLGVLAVVVVAAGALLASGNYFQGSFLAKECPAKTNLIYRAAEFTYNGIAGEVGKIIPAHFYTGEVVVMNLGQTFTVEAGKHVNIAKTMYTGEVPQLIAIKDTTFPCKGYVKVPVSLYANPKSPGIFENGITAVNLKLDPNKIVPETTKTDNDLAFPIRVNPTLYLVSGTFQWQGIDFAKDDSYVSYIYTGEPTVYYTPEAKFVKANKTWLKKVGTTFPLTLEGTEYTAYSVPATLYDLQNKIMNLGTSVNSFSKVGSIKGSVSGIVSNLFTNQGTLGKASFAAKKPLFFFVKGAAGNNKYVPSTVLAIYPPGI